MPSLIELAKSDPDKARRRMNQMRNRAYSNGFFEGAMSVMGPENLCVEFGVGVGETTQKLAQTGARVVAYEADPQAFEQAQAHLSGFETLELIHAALGVSDGKAKLHRSAEFEEGKFEELLHTSVMPKEKLVPADIEVERLDAIKILKDLIDQSGHIDILLIDINGSELEILELMMKEQVFDHINLTVAKSYQRDFKLEADRYRALRGKLTSTSEWNILIEKV